MKTIELTALNGSNPAAFLAALGVLHAAPVGTRLSWVARAGWTPVLHGTDAAEELLDWLEADLERWKTDSLLTDMPFPDLKPTPADYRDTIQTYFEMGWERRLNMLGSLVTLGLDTKGKPAEEKKTSGKGKKSAPKRGATETGLPTELFLGGGPQKMLEVAEKIMKACDRKALSSTLWGPWDYNPKLGGFRWEQTSARVHALSLEKPENDKRTVVGVEWLAFRGLTLLASLTTPKGKASTVGIHRNPDPEFSWPIWSAPAALPSVEALLSDGDIKHYSPAELLTRGVVERYASHIIWVGDKYRNLAPPHRLEGP